MSKSNSHCTVVMLHGLGGDLTAWNETINNTHRNDVRKIALDLQGMGYSRRPGLSEAYRVDHVADRVEVELQRIGIKNPVVVGHCYGGIVALELAIRGYQMKGLVLVNTASRLPGWVRWSGIGLMGKWWFYGLGLLAPNNYRDYRADYELYKKTRDFSVWRVCKDMLHTGLRSYLWLLSGVMRFNVHDFLIKIDIPTLVIAGKQDWIFPVHMSREIVREIDDAELFIMEDVGHLIPVHKPKKLGALIDKFLNKIIL